MRFHIFTREFSRFVTRIKLNNRSVFSSSTELECVLLSSCCFTYSGSKYEFITIKNLKLTLQSKHNSPTETLRAPPAGCSSLCKGSALRTSSETVGFDGAAVWTTTWSSEVMSHTPVMDLRPGPQSAEIFVTLCFSQLSEDVLPSFQRSHSPWTPGFVSPRNWTFLVELWTLVFVLSYQPAVFGCTTTKVREDCS